MTIRSIPMVYEGFPHPQSVLDMDRKTAKIKRTKGGFKVERTAGNFGYSDLFIPDLLDAIGYAEMWCELLAEEDRDPRPKMIQTPTYGVCNVPAVRVRVEASA